MFAEPPFPPPKKKQSPTWQVLCSHFAHTWAPETAGVKLLILNLSPCLAMGTPDVRGCVASLPTPGHKHTTPTHKWWSQSTPITLQVVHPRTGKCQGMSCHVMTPLFCSTSNTPTRF